MAPPFAEVAKRLGKTHRIIVPDLLGFGDAPDAPARYHAAEHAEVVVQFLGKLGIDELEPRGLRLRWSHDHAAAS